MCPVEKAMSNSLRYLQGFTFGSPLLSLEYRLPRAGDMNMMQEGWSYFWPKIILVEICK